MLIVVNITRRNLIKINFREFKIFNILKSTVVLIN